MIGANRVFLIGEVADLRFPSGNKMLSLKVKVSEQWIDRNTGEVRTKNSNHKVVLFNELQVGYLAGVLKVGDAVMVEGKLENRSWEGKDGVKQWETQVAAQAVTPLQHGTGAPPPAHQTADGTAIAADEIPF